MVNKYLRIITGIGGTACLQVDVYSVLEAFSVSCPARQHAIKKLLCAGLRGKGDTLQDLREAAVAVKRAVEMEEARVETTERGIGDQAACRMEQELAKEE